MSREKHSIIPIKDHKRPTNSARRTITQYYKDALRLLPWYQEEHYVANEELQRTDDTLTNAVMDGPAYAHALDDITERCANWRKHTQHSDNIIVFVLPYGDSGLIADYADAEKLTLLDPPDRSTICTYHTVPDITLPDSDIIVIARLEAWFLRHRNGLHLLRGLLHAIEHSHARFLIGCNSWAWQFLQKALNVHFVLPTPCVLAPYKSQHLATWFHTMIADEDIIIKSAKDGKDIFTRTDDGDYTHPYFRNLAAHSHGIPWVAYAHYCRSLRRQCERDGDDDHENTDNTTIWISELSDFVLPEHRQGNDNEEALLILHALLLHGELHAAQLQKVLPVIEQSNIMFSLVDAGFLNYNNGVLSCTELAYPALYKALTSAGLPLDALGI